ncbi:MAG: thiol peroxidase [Flammeovirgaceae bacterium]
MSQVTFAGNPIDIAGEFPQVGQQLPEFRLLKTDLSELSYDELKGKKVVFNVFPSVDTGICALSLKTFSSKLKDRSDVVLVFTSLDLPFAFKRFCAAEGIENAITTSDFRHRDWAKNNSYMASGPLTGLYARGVLVTDENLKIIHSELVPEITQEPDYDTALTFL